MEETGRITLEVIDRIRQDPGTGVDAFVRRWGPRLLVFIRYKLGGRLGTKVEPEDVLQDFFAGLVAEPERFLERVDERGVHRAAFRQLENRIKDLYEHHYETAKRSAKREVRKDASPGDDAGGLGELEGRGASFTRRIEVEDEYRSLESMLARLEGDARHLFVLKFVEELTNQEIADELGVSVSTVKRETQDLIRAIQRLRKGS